MTGNSWEPRALGPYNMVGDPFLEGGLAIARQPGLDWSDPYRPDPPGYVPEPWEVKFDEACRLLEARGRRVGTGDPAVDAALRTR
jgi:hypothetical protein